MPKFLLIQTAFIGDVVLGTAVAEKLHSCFPDASIDFLVRKGNEGLLKNHPFLNTVIVWNKKQNKLLNLLKIIRDARKANYTHVINLHRFASSGFITAFSGAPNRVGFDKNPLSFLFTKKLKHIISEPYTPNPIHETQRNQLLIADLTGTEPAFPRLYPSSEDEALTASLKEQPYICIAPSSVWFTKQFPVSQWVALVNRLPARFKIYLLGGPGDQKITEEILRNGRHQLMEDMSGKLSFLQSASLMKDAAMNYVNDSAPLHFASAVHAPVTAVYCSTVPAFGFGPLRDNGTVVAIEERLYCRPCGLHGYKACPEGHFRCALDIKTEQLLWWL